MYSTQYALKDLNRSSKHSHEYKETLASLRWKMLKWYIEFTRGPYCERCGCRDSDDRMDLHHESYNRVGYEIPSDVTLLCRDCHEKIEDEKRHRRELARAENISEEYFNELNEIKETVEEYVEDDDFLDRLNDWACAQYGDDWFQKNCYSKIRKEYIEFCHE